MLKISWCSLLARLQLMKPLDFEQHFVATERIIPSPFSLESSRGTRLRISPPADHTRALGVADDQREGECSQTPS
jgi:hypothetical protein